MYSTAFLDIPPLQQAGGTVTLPGSKSISNRVLLLAALSAGETCVHDLLDSDDTRVMLGALQQLGCGIERSGPQQVKVRGLGGQLSVRRANLFLGNAGTAMRPLTAALALLATRDGAVFEVSGVARMHERPIGDLVDGLTPLGCVVEPLGTPGYPPLRLGDGQAHPLNLDAPIKVRGNVSSQFLTALLLALPLVAERDIVIEVVGELISKPYIEITLQLLSRFGVHVQREAWQRFTIPAGSRYTSPGQIHVEGDASSASYFIALGALAPSESGITVQGVGLRSIQGDIRFIEAAQAMGAVIEGGDNHLHIRRGAWPLRAIDLDCNHIPDAAMTLAVMALYADGSTTLRNIESWRVKETDRIAAMATELRKLGAEVTEGQDFIRITPPSGTTAWQAACIHTYDDHRVAMCFSLAAFNPAGLPVRIEDPKCVAKTFPDYFETWFGVVQAKASDIPVLCIDGPTASGKGTLARQVAQSLGYHWLDSGALYRVTAEAARRAGLALSADQAPAIARLARQLPVRFEGEQVWLDGVDVTEAIRSEVGGMNASKVSAFAEVRAALLQWQQACQRLPGLVTDGRDMGTVVFPEAPLKVFLDANVTQRAQRRHQQLLSRGINARLEDLLADLQERDLRDRTRQAAPLQAAADAFHLDNSALDIDTSVQQVLSWWQAKRPFEGA